MLYFNVTPHLNPEHRTVTPGDKPMTKMLRVDPFRDLQSLKNKMDRLFEDSFQRSEGAGILQGAWEPSIDIYETDTELVLEAELPGVLKENVTVTVDKDQITLKGERKFDKETQEENYHRIERSYGTFSRTFTLPGEVDASKIEAVQEDGVLRVTIPKKPEAQPREIEVKVK